jgi:hypothetical protein
MDERPNRERERLDWRRVSMEELEELRRRPIHRRRITTKSANPSLFC